MNFRSVRMSSTTRAPSPPLSSTTKGRIQRPQVRGKFLFIGRSKVPVRRVTYGTFSGSHTRFRIAGRDIAVYWQLPEKNGALSRKMFATESQATRRWPEQTKCGGFPGGCCASTDGQVALVRESTKIGFRVLRRTSFVRRKKASSP